MADFHHLAVENCCVNEFGIFPCFKKFTETSLP